MAGRQRLGLRTPSNEPAAATEAEKINATPPEPIKAIRDWLAYLIPVFVAVVAFGAGWYTNSQTIQAQKDQAVDQFRRDQRRDQYAAILQQATRLENAGGFSSTAAALGLQFGQIAVAEQALAAQGRGAWPVSDPHQGIVSGGNWVINTGAVAGGGNGDFRSTWQDAYTGLDQAISNSEIASSKQAINLARALRDKYRDDYYKSVLASIDKSLPSWPDPKPDRLKLAESLVGVTVDAAAPPTYDVSLLSKSADELTALYVDAAKADLGLDDR